MSETRTRLTAILAAVVLSGVACEAIDGPTGTTPEATDPDVPTVEVTVTETVTETVEPVESPPDGVAEDEEDPLRSLIVAPQEPRRVDPGSDGEFSVPGRLDGEELPDLLGFAWTPCEEVDATDRGELLFVDEDGDGHADAMGASDTGAARLYSVNGERYENVDDEWPVALHTRDQTPALEFTMRANDPDCATIVVFIDGDEDEQLDLADDLTPAETYGVAEISWTDT